MDLLLTARAARRALPLLCAALAAAASAQIFSPGELARPHAAFEGLRQCTRCHPAGGELSAESCLACHPEVGTRIERGEGFHGRMPADERRACERCHPDHQGVDASLIDWTPSKKQFPHARTGWPLQGKHEGLECAQCHEPRRIVEPDIRALLARSPRRETYLGLRGRCAGCHFDEHRGQLKGECARCHDARGWRPAPGFDHGKTDFALTGLHKKVACADCHPTRADERTAADAFPAPVARKFVAFGDLPHQSCQDCHQDPHDGRFGPACSSCHTTAGWKQVASRATEAGFHDKTRFPLEGLHAAVPCKACHGPSKGQKARFKGLAFAACTDCHLDAHLGQLRGPDRKKAAACDGCHSVDGFLPARFELEDHARTAYPLEGGHQAAPCTGCHRDEPELRKRVKDADERRLAKQGRPLRLSLALFDLPKRERCGDCHDDPHRGEFEKAGAARACADCHQVSAFARVTFDHAKDTTFALTGKHAAAECASCHGRGAAARYRGLPAHCAGCHADAHAGQLGRPRGTAGECERCHDTAAFKPAPRFTHAPPFTDYLLEGRHRDAPCAACHREVEIAGAKVRRYRPLPRECEGCHDDFHRGAFSGFSP